MDDVLDQFFAGYDQRRALASIARGVLRRQACGGRGYVVIWPHIPTMQLVTGAHVAERHDARV